MPDSGDIKPIKSVDADGNTYIFAAPVRRDGDSGFTKVFWNRYRDIVTGCSSADFKVLDLLVTRGSTGKPVNLTVKEIAKLEHLNRRTVQDALSFFIKKDMIRRGSHWDIYVNPDIIFRGKQYYRDMARDVYRTLPSPVANDDAA